MEEKKSYLCAFDLFGVKICNRILVCCRNTAKLVISQVLSQRRCSMQHIQDGQSFIITVFLGVLILRTMYLFVFHINSSILQENIIILAFVDVERLH